MLSNSKSKEIVTELGKKKEQYICVWNIEWANCECKVGAFIGILRRAKTREKDKTDRARPRQRNRNMYERYMPNW